MATIPHLATATLLLNVQADALTLADGDPVSTWADLSGLGNHFAQTGSARPTYRADVEGGPAIYFDPSGGAQWLLGPDFADNLPSFTVIIVAKYDVSVDWNTPVLTKIDNIFSSTGWQMDVSGSGGATEARTAGGDMLIAVTGVLGAAAFRVTAHDVVSLAAAHQYVDGSTDDEDTSSSTGTVTTTANAEPVRIGGSAQDALNDNTFSGWIRAVMLFAPALDAGDRATIEGWARDKYGLPIIMLQSSVVAFWQMNEPSGTRGDATAHNQHLTDVHGPVYGASGAVGDGARFVAADGAYLQTASTSDLQIATDRPYTITAWVKLQANHAQTIISKGLAGVHEYRLYYDGAGAFCFTYNDMTVSVATAYDDTVFFFLEAAFLARLNTMSLRVNNGAPTTVLVDPANGDAGALSIGGDAANDPADPTVASAIIDAVCIWRRTLRSDDRALLYAGAVWPFGVALEVFRAATDTDDSTVTLAYDALTRVVVGCTINHTGGSDVLTVDLYKVEGESLILWQQLIAQPGASLTRSIAAGLTVGLLDGEIDVGGGNMSIQVHT